MSEQIKPLDVSDALHEEFVGPLTAPIENSASLVTVQPYCEHQFRKPPKRKSITTLTLNSRTCTWPVGDPVESDFHYCGELPQTGRVYCDTHDRMSYQPVRSRKGVV